MATEKKVITMHEASQHNTRDDCWIVIDGKVYDVSSYLDEHPGGDDVILNVAGKDATDDFEDVGHSDMAREELKTFYIGDLDPATAPPIPELKFITKTNTDDKSRILKDLAKQYWTIPVTVIGISVIVGVLHLRRRAH